MKQTIRQTIENHLSAGYPALQIITHEEQRFEQLIAEIAKAKKFQLARWTCVGGISEQQPDGMWMQIPETEAPAAAMEKFIGQLLNKTILLMPDLHLFIEDPMFYRWFKDACVHAKTRSKHIIIIGCRLVLPPEIEKCVTVIDFDLPDRKQLKTLLRDLAESNKKTVVDEEAVINAATGLTTFEAEDAFSLSAVECGKIQADVVHREKSLAIKKGGILEVIDPGSIDQIGGLDILKPWVERRRSAYTDEARKYGLPNPKGCMMFGPPGTGKTLVAKAIAGILQVPLLKLDCGALFGSLVGESEKNMRTVIKQVEASAPCVLLADEIEKGFSGSASSGQTDGGTSARVLGTFLQWMNDKSASVFVVATANNIKVLPPELMRKGRFDELWFVDLPSRSERSEIWKIVITKFGRSPKKFDIDALSTITQDWTGAEIEALFRDSLFTAFDSGVEPSTEMLVSMARQSVPLAVTMSDVISDIRNFAKGKARRAASEEPVAQETGAIRRIA